MDSKDVRERIRDRVALDLDAELYEALAEVERLRGDLAGAEVGRDGWRSRAVLAEGDAKRLRDSIHTFYIKWAGTGREPDWSALQSLLDGDA